MTSAGVIEDKMANTESGGAYLEQRLTQYGPYQIFGLRDGRFKYHARHGLLYGNPMDWSWGPFIDRGPWLFDLELDPDESYDVSERYTAIAGRLRALLESRRRELRDNPRGWL